MIWENSDQSYSNGVALKQKHLKVYIKIKICRNNKLLNY